jgi:hypothetical protein
MLLDQKLVHSRRVVCFVELDTGEKTISFDIFEEGLWLNLLLLVQSLLFCGDLMYGQSFC